MMEMTVKAKTCRKHVLPLHGFIALEKINASSISSQGLSPYETVRSFYCNSFPSSQASVVAPLKEQRLFQIFTKQRRSMAILASTRSGEPRVCQISVASCGSDSDVI